MSWSLGLLLLFLSCYQPALLTLLFVLPFYCHFMFLLLQQPFAGSVGVLLREHRHLQSLEIRICFLRRIAEEGNFSMLQKPSKLQLVGLDCTIW